MGKKKDIKKFIIGHAWKDKDTGLVFMTRCIQCGRENYAPAVASGVCVWCGYDANKNWKDIEKGMK